MRMVAIILSIDAIMFDRCIEGKSRKFFGGFDITACLSSTKSRSTKAQMNARTTERPQVRSFAHPNIDLDIAI